MQWTSTVVVPCIDLTRPHVQQPPHQVPPPWRCSLVQRKISSRISQPKICTVSSDHLHRFELSFGTAAVRWSPPFSVLPVGIGSVGQQQSGGICVSWGKEKMRRSGEVERYFYLEWRRSGGPCNHWCRSHRGRRRIGWGGCRCSRCGPWRRHSGGRSSRLCLELLRRLLLGSRPGLL